MRSVFQFFRHSRRARGIHTSSAAAKEIHTEGSHPVRLSSPAITTGSTADVCAHLLKDAGASKVYVAAAAVSGV